MPALSFYGAWGAGIFEDDFTCDVRDDYEQLLSDGKSNDDALSILKKRWLLEEDEDNQPLFWVAVALTQQERGILQKEVKEEALSWLEQGADLERWKGTPQEAKRKQALGDAKTALESNAPSLPKPSVQSVPPWMRSDPWEAGDILTYKITREKIPYPEYVGRYLVLRVKEMGFEQINKTHYANYAIYAGCFKTVPSLEDVKDLGYLTLYEANDYYTGDYFYQSAVHIDFIKDELETHEVHLITHDPDFFVPSDEFLANGRNRATMGTHSFDIMISKILHEQGL